MRGTALLLIAALLLPTGVSAREKKEHAPKQDLIKKEKRLEDVRKQIRDEKESIKAISEKETSVLEELDKINRELAEKREALRQAEASMGTLTKGVNSVSGNIAVLEREKKDLSGRLKARLKAMYKMRRGEMLSVLFSSASPDEAGRKHRTLARIMDVDVNLIESYEKNIKKLAEEKQKLTVLYKDLDVARSEAAARKGEAEAVRKSKVALLSSIKQEKDRKTRTVAELEQAARELQDLVGRLRAKESKEAAQDEPAGTGFGAMKGRLPMPVKGKVVSQYGKVKHPRFQTVTFNNGIVIEAPSGTPVKNVYEGRVVYAGWLKGYGQVLIVDHKGGYYSLYAYLSQMLKKVGDAVEKGVEVGLVGDSGVESSSGLYFEIRHKGAPRDPLSWLIEK